MTTKEKFIEFLNLPSDAFDKDVAPKDRMDELEECIVELAEIIGGAEK